MNWDAIAAIGEILGASAVLVTLVYLSVQISQNTKQLSENAKALRRNELNVLMQNWSDLRRLEMSDPSLAEILVRAEKDFESLDEIEVARYSAHVSERLWINHHLWERVQEGIIPSDHWERGRGIVTSLVRTRGADTVWDRMRPYFDPGFVSDIESETGSIQRENAV